MSRFANVKYDECTQDYDKDILNHVEHIERVLNLIKGDDLSRTHSIAMTKLEEFHMWARKFLRDAQFVRQAATKAAMDKAGVVAEEKQ